MTRVLAASGARDRARRRRISPFVLGLLSGLALILGGRLAINRTTVPDLLISPLLRADTAGPADAIVVMGAAVTGPCVPNLNAVRRVLLAARLWRQGRAPLVVFTGGSSDGSCPSAAAMARLAAEVGVGPSSIQIEATSRTTRENAEHASLLLRRFGVGRVLVVTDRLHMRRSAGVFAATGFEVERASVPIYEGHPDNVSMLAAGAREFAALTYYRLRGWIVDPPAAAPTTSKTSEVTSAAARRGGEPVGDVVNAHTGTVPTSGPIVVLGASYAGGWKPERLAGLAVSVRGVSGQQSYEMLERFEPDVVAARPRAVIIWGFINDFFRTAPEQADATSERILQNFTRMIELARANGIEPILASEVTIRPRAAVLEPLMSWVGWLRGKEAYTDRINRHVMAVNGRLADLARGERLLLLDFQNTLGEAGGRRRKEFAAEDGSHINAAGYAALTSYARLVLEQHFAR